MVIAFTRYPPLVNSFRGGERDEGNNKILSIYRATYPKFLLIKILRQALQDNHYTPHP